MEKYKTHPEYTKYEISNFGNIRNIKTKRVLKKRIDRCGYERINLFGADSVAKTFSVHRLVAETWIGKIENDFVVDHIDRNRTNNYASNLRIVTQKENNNNRIKMTHCLAYCEDLKMFYSNGFYFEDMDDALLEFNKGIKALF